MKSFMWITEMAQKAQYMTNTYTAGDQAVTYDSSYDPNIFIMSSDTSRMHRAHIGKPAIKEHLSLAESDHKELPHQWRGCKGLYSMGATLFFRQRSRVGGYGTEASL